MKHKKILKGATGVLGLTAIGAGIWYFFFRNKQASASPVPDDGNDIIIPPSDNTIPEDNIEIPPTITIGNFNVFLPDPITSDFVASVNFSYIGQGQVDVGIFYPGILVNSRRIELPPADLYAGMTVDLPGNLYEVLSSKGVGAIDCLAFVKVADTPITIDADMLASEWNTVTIV